MKTLVLGAGIIGISTAWHLAERGHEVIVVDRQRDAALETSFANAAQISVSYCEPWANRHAPAKLVSIPFRRVARIRRSNRDRATSAAATPSTSGDPPGPATTTGSLNVITHTSAQARSMSGPAMHRRCSPMASHLRASCTWLPVR